jgi:hypothetical protein
VEPAKRKKKKGKAVAAEEEPAGDGVAIDLENGDIPETVPAPENI